MGGDVFLEALGIEDDDNFNVESRSQSNVVEMPRKETETFPCGNCGGTGLYQGRRVNQTKSHCFACNGRGYFKMSYGDRIKARQARQNRSELKSQEAWDAFVAEHKDLAKHLERGAQKGNDFSRSMIDAVKKYGKLTERQLAASYRGYQKYVEAIAAREEQTNTNLNNIIVSFTNALENGMKRPVLRYDSYKLSLAPKSGRNAGFVYVKRNNEYIGKISPDGEWNPTFAAKPEDGEILAWISKDPAEAARKHGRETGQCCCCGRELTDPKSIEAGIGPICASNYGF